jgi:branched-chain amino acid transport system substrate-binding protein
VVKIGEINSYKAQPAFSDLQVDSPFGKITYRAQDHQSTMGAYVGKTKNQGGKGVMVDYSYFDGVKYLPSDAEVKKLRAADLAIQSAECARAI